MTDPMRPGTSVPGNAHAATPDAQDNPPTGFECADGSEIELSSSQMEAILERAGRDAFLVFMYLALHPDGVTAEELGSAHQPAQEGLAVLLGLGYAYRAGDAYIARLGAGQ